MSSSAKKGAGARNVFIISVILFGFGCAVLDFNGAELTLKYLGFVLALCVAMASIWVGQYNYRLELSRKRAQNYEWFKATFPEQVQSGKVTCECGCSRIHVRHLMNGTYLRSHSCSACGTTLYYTQEG